MQLILAGLLLGGQTPAVGSPDGSSSVLFLFVAQDVVQDSLQPLLGVGLVTRRQGGSQTLLEPAAQAGQKYRIRRLAPDLERNPLRLRRLGEAAQVAEQGPGAVRELEQHLEVKRIVAADYSLSRERAD